MTPDALSLHRQLEAMRPQLVRFAQLQLRNEALAEDAQAVVIGAVVGPDDHEAAAGQAGFADVAQPDAAGGPVDQGEAVEEEGRGERAEVRS